MPMLARALQSHSFLCEIKIYWVPIKSGKKRKNSAFWWKHVLYVNVSYSTLSTSLNYLIKAIVVHITKGFKYNCGMGSLGVSRMDGLCTHVCSQNEESLWFFLA